MKKRALFIVFLLVLPAVIAEDWVFNSEYLDISLDITGKISLIPTSPRYTISYVIANLSFLPQDGFQEKVLDIQTEPVSEINDNAAVFRWDKPDEKELSFNVKSNVRSFNKIAEVRSKVNFPLGDIPDDVKQYTMPSETIDSDNQDIIRMASEIIKGEDDLYIVVFKLGEWTKDNVKYDLSSATESISQKASWVLRNKEGVCDELTNLFIAMSRALGIPARFISGVAYTNAKEFGEGFGPHGWAEVYFPGYGWIPFDVTYGEFGFVDASHIKLKESIDADDASTKFQWMGQNVEIKTSQLDINAALKESKGRIGDVVLIDAGAIKDETGFGSYNLIEAAVKNPNDYYAATELGLSKSKEIEIIGGDKKNVLLKPGEEKKVYWIIKVSDNLDKGYMYTFPFIVSSIRNTSSELRFYVKGEGNQFSLEGMESIITENEEEKSYSGNAEIKCNADREEIYEYESANLECDVKNTGNIYLEELSVCLENDCKKLNLGITQEGKAGFEFKPKKAGAQEVAIKASNKDVSKSAFVNMIVYDQPSIEISDIIHPNEVEYKDEYEISFVLNRKSIFSPYNVSIIVEPTGKEWELSQLSENRKFIVKMYGKELNEGSNDFMVLIKYKDRNGKSYETSESFNIELVNVNILQRVILFFRGMFR